MCYYIRPADDMGLGKTLSLISLVVQKKDEGVKEWMAKPPSKEGELIILVCITFFVLCMVDLLLLLFSGLVKSPGTLVVCPASLMMQWADEVKTKLHRGTLSTKIYHGSNRTSFAQE